MTPEYSYRNVSIVPGLELYTNYYVDIKGNVYSKRKGRFKKLKPFYSGKENNRYLKIYLYGKTPKGRSRRKSVFVHVLVARTFVPDQMLSRYIIHKNNNHYDNSLLNLISIDRKFYRKGHRAGRPRKDGSESEHKVHFDPSKEIHLRKTGTSNFIPRLNTTYELDIDTIDDIKMIHTAALEKGLHMKKSFDFVNDIVKEMLDEYATKKGLKKILYKMKNS